MMLLPELGYYEVAQVVRRQHSAHPFLVIDPGGRGCACVCVRAHQSVSVYVCERDKREAAPRQSLSLDRSIYLPSYRPIYRPISLFIYLSLSLSNQVLRQLSVSWPCFEPAAAWMRRTPANAVYLRCVCVCVFVFVYA